MRGNAPLSPITQIPGWITIAEENLLIRLASEVQDGGTIVQLGGEFGRAAGAFAFAAKQRGRENVTIFTIDRFPLNYQDVGDLKGAFLANLTEAGVAAGQEAVRSETAAFAAEWDDQDIDLLFVDAGHELAEVQADIAAWAKLVKPTGVIVFHDYAKGDGAHYLHYFVKQAVDEWHAQNPDWTRYDGVQSLVYFTGPESVGVAEVSAHSFDDSDDFDEDDDETGVVEDSTLSVPPAGLRSAVPANLPIQPETPPDDSDDSDYLDEELRQPSPADEINWELLGRDYESLSAVDKRAWTRERKKADLLQN